MKKAPFFASVSAVAIAISMPHSAHAQTTPEPSNATPAQATQADTGDIVVTARKREESIQNVPSVVSAVSGQLAEDLGGLQNTRDAVALVPGVTMIESAQGPTAEPNIRGAGQARLPNSDAAIGLYRNGAYIVGGNLGGRSFQRFDLFDIDRIEVLRGPQGALYGRNAVGGAINVISKPPTFDRFSGELTGIVGSQKTWGGQMIANIPVSGVFALRADADLERQRGGFYYNTVTNRVQDPMDYTAGRLSARYKPSSAFDAILTFDYASQVGDIGDVAPNPDPDGSPFLVQFNTPQRTGSHQYNISLGINWDLGFGKLVSTTNYRKRDSYAQFDNDGGNTSSQVNFYTDNAKTFFQELRLQGEETHFNWLVGADLFYLRDYYDQTLTGVAPIVTPAMGMTPASTLNPNLFQNTDYSQTGYAGFASLEYKVTDKFSLEGEGRYSIDEKDVVIDARRADGTPRYAAFPPGSAQAMPSGTFHNASFGATASYKFTPEILGFARVATAYRAGGFNSELGTPCGTTGTPGTNCNVIDVPISYDPEHSINYEVGLKTGWFHHRLLVNANVYRINYTDILVNLNNGVMAAVDPLDMAMFLTNAGDAYATGFEIEMSARPKLPSGFGQLEVTGSIAHQAGHITSVNPAITTVVSGNELARLRPFSYNANAVWRLPLGGGYQFLTAFNYVFEHGGRLNPENTFLLDTTRRGNLRLALSKNPWELGFQVANLFNNIYYVNQSGTAINGIGAMQRFNDPRSYQFTLKLKW